jgi:type I restriction enzyme M protein
MTEAQKQRLETQLWNIANELRGKMDADEFRDYILGFIFYKYLSEKQHLFANKLLETEDVKDYADIEAEEDVEAIKEESLEKLGYFLRPSELFSEISRKGNADAEEESNFILEDLQSILNSIEQSTMGTDSEDDFNKLFEDLDLSSTKLGRSVEARNSLIARVLKHLDKIDFQLGKVDSDVLGDAYEYLISKFASGAGKKAGEFYTPQQVSKILAKIVTLDKKRIKSAYDPTCGSGSLLLRIAKEADVGEFHGQELNRTTYNLARMNMILHDVHYSRFDIRQEDTLEEPQHLDERFEAVVANPPFSAKWKGSKNPLNETDDRFSQYGKIAPSSKADFAFVQHMIYQLADNGTAAVVLPHGVLFRGASEGAIREYVIKDLNYLDAVIGLPPNLFYGTSIPASILVLKKCRVHDDNILFIDASAEFEKVGNQNVLTDEHVAKIIGTYSKREELERYAHVAPLSEVAANNYNLNIPRYVDTFEEEEPVDLDAVAKELKVLELKMTETDRLITGFCTELGITAPVSSQASS